MTMHKSFVISIVLAGFSVLPAAALSTGGGATCYNCDNFFGPWTCSTTSLSGGLTCTLGQDSCTVSGNCNSGSSSGLVAVGAGTIRQIAVAHPRVAATVFELTKNGRVASTASVSWNADSMDAQQVANLVSSGSAGLQQSPGIAVVYDAYVQPRTGGASLVIVPKVEYSEDPVFTEFRLELTLNNGVLVPTSWSLR